MENNKENPINKIKLNEQNKENNENLSKKITEIDSKYKYLEENKNIVDKIVIHSLMENIKIIGSNQDIIENKINFLKLNKELNNIKKPELDLKLQLKKQTKNIIFEEMLNNNNERNNMDEYFKIEDDAFNYGNNNKNILYKSRGLIKI